MIVKIKNSKEGWSYFECEIIHSGYELLKNVVSSSDAVILLDEQPDEPKSSILNIKILNLETQKTHLRTILTDRVCYIVNNAGKTIDRI